MTNEGDPEEEVAEDEQAAAVREPCSGYGQAGGEPATVWVPTGDASEVSALIAEGETYDRSPQEIVDEIHAAAEAEAGVSETRVRSAREAVDQRTPFFIGMSGALGVAVIYASARSCSRSGRSCC